MRQLKRSWGICTFAVLAFVVAGVSTAQAAEVGECLKLEKVEGVFHGKYVDKNCQVAATPLQEAEGKHNKWEWSPGVKPENAPYTAKTKSAELVGAAGTIRCSKSTTVGEWTSATTGTEQTTFEGCEGQPNIECHSAGQTAGTIVTNPLSVKLVGHNETGYGGAEPAEGEVWEDLASESGAEGVWAEYDCAKFILIRKTGSVAGVFTAASVNALVKRAEVEFNGVLGEEPGKFGEQDLQDEASIGGGPFEPAGQAIEKTTVLVRYHHKIEIRA